MASALESITAQYTDSEGEEEKSPDPDNNSQAASQSSALDRGNPEERSETPGSGTSVPSNKSSPKRAPVTAMLVSYQDPDGGLSDEEREPVPMELESDEENKSVEGNGEENGDTSKDLERSHLMEELWEEGVKLPPEPSGQCSRELQDKIEKMWKRKMETGLDMNAIIQNKKAFRNPSMYEKLLLHLNIDELGTNFPPELYDGHLFGKESYYDELAKMQKQEMDRREKQAAEQKKKMDGKPKEGLVVPQRKSKWDQGATAAIIPPIGVMKPGLALSTTAKVIPAFGSLKKK